MSGPERLLRLRPGVRHRIVGGEGVIVLQESGEVVVVNELGARIVDLLARRPGVRAEALVSELAAAYDVERDTLEADVRAFVAELVSGGIAEFCADQDSLARSDETT